ncbi:MAG: ATP synthase subunit C [Promethearchaeota archaeon]
MNTKKRFAVSLGLLQILLVIIVYITVDRFIIPVAAQPTLEDPAAIAGLAIGVALTLGLTSIGAGLALKTVATAAISAITEREGAFGKVLVFVAFSESLAIFGFIVGIMLLQKIP